MHKFITTSYEQTQKIGKKLAKEILNLKKNKNAVVIGLSGNLGGGKTTFIQGFAKGLGIKEKILSPTFVILKRFKITKPKTQNPKSEFINFYHFDCYRVKNEKDIIELGFEEVIKNPGNIIAIEWPERVKKVLPQKIIVINFKFTDKNKREVVFDFENGILDDIMK